MLLYSHLIWAIDLSSFMGDDAWVNNSVARSLHDGTFGVADAGRSYLATIDSMGLHWTHHLFAIAVTVCFAIGLMTRITAPLAWFLQLMILHRMTGLLFGLDQIVTYSAMYLMVSPCGAALSVDAHVRDRLSESGRSNAFWSWLLPGEDPGVLANIATRLLQIHLCVIYLFGGLAKARGTTWWDGTAVWYSVANFEYQSVDLTWLSDYPRVFSALSHATMFWEIFYVALIWPRLTRPLMLALAVAVHGGIALFLGMITFGTMMIAANVIFIHPDWLRGKWRSTHPR